ncbi:hypothetical protein [Sorangium sp. So ce406]|uniref:hypothetical protein n=1 Tax=Sorangium sp. So ce406 TaxID=3133311 RepID=UPI003F5B7FFD
MKRSVFALGMMMAVGLLPAACGPASQIEGELAGPGLRAMAGKPGSEDTNGTPKRAWHTWKEPLVRALGRPLLQADGTISPVVLATGLLDGPDGEGVGGGGAGGGGDGDGAEVPGHEVFDHAVRCALASGTAVTHNGTLYKGLGMVKDASGWIKEGLADHVKDNVLECVIAFVNDKTDGVNVLLTGLNVEDDEGDHDPFIYPEAVWCADAASGAAVDVYATRSFMSRCGMDPEAALEQRYCYEKGSCGLNYKGLLELNADCVRVGPAENGHYKCNHKACTMTWLKEPKPEWCVPPPTAPTPPTPPTPPPPPPPPPPPTPIPQ